jgi:hypothetical protein
MKSKEITKHMARKEKPYSIYTKRHTTISHAFASAIAPTDVFEKCAIDAALIALGQEDVEALTCVYCEEEAETWDHLVNLVKDGELHGYGHQLGNLVPCCKKCNSSKQGKSFELYISGLPKTEAEKLDLIVRLKRHLGLAKPIDEWITEGDVRVAKAEYDRIQLEIKKLMKCADIQADILRMSWKKVR